MLKEKMVNLTITVPEHMPRKVENIRKLGFSISLSAICQSALSTKIRSWIATNKNEIIRSVVFAALEELMQKEKVAMLDARKILLSRSSLVLGGLEFNYGIETSLAVLEYVSDTLVQENLRGLLGQKSPTCEAIAKSFRDEEEEVELILSTGSVGESNGN